MLCLLHQLGGFYFVLFYVIAALVEATAREGSEPSCVPLGQAFPRSQAATSGGRGLQRTPCWCPIGRNRPFRFYGRSVSQAREPTPRGLDILSEEQTQSQGGPGQSCFWARVGRRPS